MNHEGTLYIVPTPIGNLEDITLRGLRILHSADLIAAEDTRHTGKLLQHFQITTPQISYHEHNRTARLEALLAQLQVGKTIALVTDAGMPGISDPGYELIQACIKAEISVVPLPGANAAITALAAAGLKSDRFVFEGFLPTKQRGEMLNTLKNETRTLIFYEAPHRLLQTLQDLAAVFGGDRSVVLARELTKLHEDFWRGTLEDAIQLSEVKHPKGEYTLVVAGASKTPTLELSPAEIKLQLDKMLQQGIRRSEACRELADLTGLSRRQIYQLSLGL
ncbi:MAG: 16S rRNA (cytidine(1402)-2'-O)-methyltransferase [Gomphosphaeria aponina SAG 52.96 = DSM 107014]|uniref:Ribosomal RNA small subunit methyltransferase I n=1 Tax=Gomphosphaeria aponina SAG 52.96 = DSM 107014 TaxID=1521640 RepID=A0A941GLS2_9CHRO|nr:16S rRNA (cytidine(1402)-2'-O)-methyltransferase [Gomphosphaeria aponina SAG 52.96 = DSM 107014]